MLIHISVFLLTIIIIMARFAFIIGVLLIAFVSSEGRVNLGKDQTLTWSFPNPNTVHFELWVPDALSAGYGWTGLGFKDLKDGTSMKKSDIVSIYLVNDRVEDAYAVKNGKPQADVAYGTTDDIQEFPVRQDSGYRVYGWDRVLDTGDAKYDHDFVKDETIYVLWACGQLNAEGQQMKHRTPDRGTVTIILSEDFSDSETLVSMI